MFKIQKIRHRMIVYYSLVILLCVYIISSFSYYQASKVIINNTSENVHRVLEQSSENIDKTLEDIETVVNTFLANQAVYNIMQFGKTSFVVQDRELINIYDILSDITLIRPEIESIFVFDYRDKIYSNSRYEGKWSYEDLKSQAENGKGKIVWLEPDEATSSNTYVRVIKNDQLVDIGFLVVNIRKSSLEKLFRWQEASSENKNLIIDENGAVIVSSFDDINKIYQEGALVDSEAFKVYSYESGYNNWQYISIVEKDVLLNDAKAIKEGVFIWGIVFTCIFWAISYLISYEITIPIRKITDSIKEFEVKGNVPSIHFRKKDELSYLYDTFIEMTHRINTLVVENYEQSVLQKKQQIELLQAQINPHFLYNTLDIINWKAREKNVPEIGSMIKALSNNLRYTFAGDAMVVTLEDEINHIKDYLYLQQYRFQDELKYSFTISDGILRDEILQLTLQPIVENCLRHGFKELEKDLRIDIHGYEENGNLYVVIKDNGRGISKDKLKSLLDEAYSLDKKGESIGIHNVNKRLTLKYGPGYGLLFESEVNVGTKVTIVLPTSTLDNELGSATL